MQRARLKNLYQLINGFETTFSLEILSSIHYVIKNNTITNDSDVVEKIGQWNNRKKQLIDEGYVQLVHSQLKEYSHQFELY